MVNKNFIKYGVLGWIVGYGMLLDFFGIHPINAISIVVGFFFGPIFAWAFVGLYIIGELIYTLFTNPGSLNDMNMFGFVFILLLSIGPIVLIIYYLDINHYLIANYNIGFK